MDNLLDRISIDPRICHGQACVKGTRIMAWLIVQYLAHGDAVEDILAAYPSLTRDDVQACLAYAAEMARERVLPVEVSVCPDEFGSMSLAPVPPDISLGRVKNGGQ